MGGEPPLRRSRLPGPAYVPGHRDLHPLPLVAEPGGRRVIPAIIALVLTLMAPPAPPLAAPSAHIGTALIGGNISQAQPSFGPRYLAVRAPRGTLVRICAATCVVMPTTDYGPSSRIRPPRIADLALVVWRKVCGLPDARGLCRGSVEFLGRAPRPPATDTE